MTDQYPLTDEAQSVSLDFEYPDSPELNRFLPLLKWLLPLPHHVILSVLSVLSLAVTVIAWFAIILRGETPSRPFWLCGRSTALVLARDRIHRTSYHGPLLPPCILTLVHNNQSAMSTRVQQTEPPLVMEDRLKARVAAPFPNGLQGNDCGRFRYHRLRR